MSKDKSIVVRIDGKRLTKNSKLGDYERESREEIAATEDSSENRIHTYTRDYDVAAISNSSAIHKYSKFDMFKPIIIAIASALIIGSILGIVMLRVIVSFDNSVNSSPAILVPDDENAANKDEDTESQGNNLTMYTIEPMSAYVIQGGIFSTAENAGTVSSQFSELGYSPFVWEKDNQFFLLVQVAKNKENLQEDITFLTDNGLDVYGKEWVVNGKEIELTKEQYDWITLFQQTWITSLTDGQMKQEEWEIVLDSVPDQSDTLSSFGSELAHSIQQISQVETNQLLLTIWADYQSYLSN